MLLRRFLPLIVAACVALGTVTPAHAEELLDTSTVADTPGEVLRLSIVGNPTVGQELFGRLDGRGAEDKVTGVGWFADGVRIAGAVTGRIVPTASHLGALLTVQVTLEGPGHDPITLTSEPAGPVVPGHATATVSIDGVPFPGYTLTAKAGTTPAFVVPSYQWSLSGTPVAGATSASLTLTTAMVGKLPSVAVTVAAEGIVPATATAGIQGAVRPAAVINPQLYLDSQAFAGRMLDLHEVTWEPSVGVSSRYEWLLDGKVLPQRNDAFLFVRPEWLGRSISVRVTGSHPGFTPGVVTSAPLRVIEDSQRTPLNVLVDRTNGVLKVYPSEFPRDATITYQWLRRTEGGVETPISGETGDQYAPSRADRNRDFVVVLTVKTVDGQVLNLRSAPVKVADVFDLYITPGQHSVNGREWRTTCQGYSRTTRCRTEIWATQVLVQGDRYVKTNGWVFNNLTYDWSEAKLWNGNPLARPGAWTAADGRKWKTECFAVALPHSCRSFAWTSYIGSRETARGWQYFPTQGWVFNNQVHLR